MTMAKDDAWFIMNELGSIGSVHFVDLNKGEQAFSLPYAGQIRRCDESLRRLEYDLSIFILGFSIINKECKKLKIKIDKVGTVQRFVGALSRLREERRKAENVFLDEIEQDVI